MLKGVCLQVGGGFAKAGKDGDREKPSLSNLFSRMSERPECLYPGISGAVARGITGQGSKSHHAPEERLSVQWRLVGTTVGCSIRVEGQMGIPNFSNPEAAPPRKGIHGDWGAPGSVWFLTTDSVSILKSWNSSNSSLSHCSNGAAYSEAKHMWFPSAQVILSVLPGPQESVTGSMRTPDGKPRLVCSPSFS